MFHNSSNIAVVILAAGASKRMGTPKQLLNWGSETLISLAIQKALKLNTDEVVVILGANYELIQEEIKHFPITILNNKDWKLGLGKSIAFSVDYLLEKKTKMDGVLIKLVDQPFITVAYLNELILNFSTENKKIIATLYDNKKLGVPAIFDKTYFKKLFYLNDDYGAKNIMKENESVIKALIPPVKNVDLDSKEDYERFYKANFE